MFPIVELYENPSVSAIVKLQGEERAIAKAQRGGLVHMPIGVTVPVERFIKNHL